MIKYRILHDFIEGFKIDTGYMEIEGIYPFYEKHKKLRIKIYRDEEKKERITKKQFESDWSYYVNVESKNSQDNSSE